MTTGQSRVHSRTNFVITFGIFLHQDFPWSKNKINHHHHTRTIFTVLSSTAQSHVRVFTRVILVKIGQCQPARWLQTRRHSCILDLWILLYVAIGKTFPIGICIITQPVHHLVNLRPMQLNVQGIPHIRFSIDAAKRKGKHYGHRMWIDCIHSYNASWKHVLRFKTSQPNPNWSTICTAGLVRDHNDWPCDAVVRCTTRAHNHKQGHNSESTVPRPQTFRFNHWWANVCVNELARVVV